LHAEGVLNVIHQVCHHAGHVDGAIPQLRLVALQEYGQHAFADDRKMAWE
jgi:hypothetical protein